MIIYIKSNSISHHTSIFPINKIQTKLSTTHWLVLMQHNRNKTVDSSRSITKHTVGQNQLVIVLFHRRHCHHCLCDHTAASFAIGRGDRSGSASSGPGRSRHTRACLFLSLVRGWPWSLRGGDGGGGWEKWRCRGGGNCGSATGRSS